MMTSIIDRLIDSVEIETHLIPFLECVGWHLSDPENPRWFIMHGPNDAHGHPLQLVFPRDKTSSDRKSYARKAGEVLSAVYDEPLQTILYRVLFYDRDEIRLRNTMTNDSIVLPLQLAVSQVSNIKATVQWSACSEREAKPFFNGPLPASSKALEAFDFGHTYPGSFGFTVHAPRLPNVSEFTTQLKMDMQDGYKPPVNVPYERRIVERIARGLLCTKKAEAKQDPNLLIEEYPSAFNANMCTAVVGISRKKRATVEFKVVWSPKMKPSEDVEQVEPITLTATDYDLLEYAADRLKTIRPEYSTIRGHVRSLTASDNPQSLGTRRAVVIRCLHPSKGGAISVIAEPTPEDYEVASNAHVKWQTVEMTGILQRTGSTWRMSDIRSFLAIR